MSTKFITTEESCPWSEPGMPVETDEDRRLATAMWDDLRQQDVVRLLYSNYASMTIDLTKLIKEAKQLKKLLVSIAAEPLVYNEDNEGLVIGHLAEIAHRQGQLGQREEETCERLRMKLEDLKGGDNGCVRERLRL